MVWMLGYCTCGSSAIGYLGPFLTHLTVQDGVDVFQVLVGHGRTSPDLNRNLDKVFYAYTVKNIEPLVTLCCRPEN